MDASWFQERKRDLGLTDSQIGEALGRDRSVANKLLHGKVVVHRQHLPGLAKVFRVTQAEIAERAGIVGEPEVAQFPTADEMTEMLSEIQAQMPAMLPTAEWPRYVAEALKMRLGMLSDDRSMYDRPDRQA